MHMAVSWKPPSNLLVKTIGSVLIRSVTFRYVLPVFCNFMIRSDTFQLSSDTFFPAFLKTHSNHDTFRYVPIKFRHVPPCFSIAC